MSDYCVGYIPHLNGVPYVANRWLDVIKWPEGNKGPYYRFAIPTPNINGHPFNPDRINDYGCNKPRMVSEITNKPYVAQCLPINDIKKEERTFFVFTFTDDSLKDLEKVFIFRIIQPSPHKSSIVLRYLAEIRVEECFDNGFITLGIQELSTKIYPPNVDEASKLLLSSSFHAIRDVVHIHTHHIGKSTHDHSEVPDSVISPIISQSKMDSHAGLRILNLYDKSVAKHIEYLSILIYSAEKKIVLGSIYKEIVAIIKQAQGMLVYSAQLVQELKKLKYISPTEYEDKKDSFEYMKYGVQAFYDEINSLFNLRTSKNSGYMLSLTVFLTIVLVILTAALLQYQ
jgi:hypothetical protein